MRVEERCEERRVDALEVTHGWQPRAVVNTVDANARVAPGESVQRRDDNSRVQARHVRVLGVDLAPKVPVWQSQRWVERLRGTRIERVRATP